MSIKNYSKQHPYLARIKERTPLTAPGSSKMTYHIVLEIERDSLLFKPGDSIGILPKNDPDEVHAILEKTRSSGTEKIFDAKSNEAINIVDFLENKVNIRQVSNAFFKLLAPNDPLLLSDNKEKLTTFLHTHTLSDILSLYSLQNLSDLEKLMPLLPRFYSIANSQRVIPDQIHLLVACVTYFSNGKSRKGVSSSFLCNLASVHTTPIPIYLQPSNHFSLPKDPTASIILIGPGTGIAPFRAFLQERLALQSSGRNWLFFGERNRACDFYYESFWTELEASGHLRLDLAFSRDTTEKVYVQHKLYERRKSVWDWIQEGAYVYVCGDAETMAKDVDAILHRIAHEEGLMTEEAARLYIKHLRASKRYLMDVY